MFTGKISSIVLFLGGVLLILLGGTGLLSIKNETSSNSNKGIYRFQEKLNLAIITSTHEKGDSYPEVKFFQQLDREVNYNLQTSISVEKTYIHTRVMDLENPLIPDKIIIPSIKLESPVIVADFNLTKIQDGTYGQWVAPSHFSAGWHPDSALLGKAGNTVINGHHNAFGEVFGHLVELEIGDIIIIISENKEFRFVVANKLILAERFQTAEDRLDNARWLAHTDDIRLTLVTCYPKESNTHRLILVARPID